MGHNDHRDDADPPLPEAAGQYGPKGFEPDENWLRSASSDDQVQAMRAWFFSRYWDPANETPYDSEEGGYLWVYGGPFEARDELGDRFGELVPDELIEEAVEGIESNGITEWAPIHTEPPDYDAAFEYEANSREDPFRFLKKRLKEADDLLAATTNESVKPLQRQLLFTSMIAALEAYLSDTMLFWIAVDKTALRRFVQGCEEFQKQKVSVSEIFDQIETIEDDVESYLQQQVWHRLDKISPLMQAALDIKIPPIAELMKHILVRHDIVHRGGRTKDGTVVTVSEGELAKLRACVLSFAEQIETDLSKRETPAPTREF